MAVDYFIGSLQDRDLELRIRDKNPLTLAEAFQIAVMLESYMTPEPERKWDEQKAKNSDQSFIMFAVFQAETRVKGTTGWRQTMKQRMRWKK